MVELKVKTATAQQIFASFELSVGNIKHCIYSIIYVAKYFSSLNQINGIFCCSVALAVHVADYIYVS